MASGVVLVSSSVSLLGWRERTPWTEACSNVPVIYGVSLFIRLDRKDGDGRGRKEGYTCQSCLLLEGWRLG